jgi:hypothetical protein
MFVFIVFCFSEIKRECCVSEVKYDVKIIDENSVF